MHQQQEQLHTAEIARHAERLHRTLKKAAVDGDTEAASLVSATVAETLRNLQRHYQAQTES